MSVLMTAQMDSLKIWLIVKLSNFVTRLVKLVLSRMMQLNAQLAHLLLL